MTEVLVLCLIGSLSYALSVTFAIRLRDDLQVPTAAALAPTAAFFAAAGARDFSVNVYFLAPVVAAGVVLLLRRSRLEAIAHGVLFLGCAVVLTTLNHGNREVSIPALAACVFLPSLYSLGEVARQKVSNRGRARVRGDAKMWWLLQAVLASASGLTMLVVDRLGWIAFVAMAGVLALTKREFDAYAVSRKAYEQTVGALDRLREVAAST